MHMQKQRLLLRHGLLVAIEAIDNDSAKIVVLHALPDTMGKFTG